MSAPKKNGARGPYAKSAQRSSDILDAATTVFATNGYHGGSLRDIARQLDVSLTSVVHHFGSKYELLEAVLERSDRTTSGDEDFDFDAACRDRGVVLATLERVRTSVDRPELLRLFAILSAESSAPNHPAHEWFTNRYQRKSAELAAALAYDQGAGRIDRGRDPHTLSRLLLASWDGVQLQWLIDPSADMEKPMQLFFESTVPEAFEGTVSSVA